MPPKSKRRKIESVPADSEALPHVPMIASTSERANAMDSDEDDADAADALPGPAAPDGDQQVDRSFLHAMPGEKYLHAIARPAKTSNAKFSDLVYEPFTRDSYLEALHSRTADQQAAALKMQQGGERLIATSS